MNFHVQAYNNAPNAVGPTAVSPLRSVSDPSTHAGHTDLHQELLLLCRALLHLRCRRCNAHLLVAVVEHTIVLAHEDVTHDPQGAVRRRHLNAHEGEEALA